MKDKYNVVFYLEILNTMKSCCISSYYFQRQWFFFFVLVTERLSNYYSGGPRADLGATWSNTSILTATQIQLYWSHQSHTHCCLREMLFCRLTMIIATYQPKATNPWIISKFSSVFFRILCFSCVHVCLHIFSYILSFHLFLNESLNKTCSWHLVVK